MNIWVILQHILEMNMRFEQFWIRSVDIQPLNPLPVMVVVKSKRKAMFSFVKMLHVKANGFTNVVGWHKSFKLVFT